MQFNYKEINALKIQPNKKNEILWVIFSQQIFIESMLCTKYYITHLWYINKQNRERSFLLWKDKY